MRRTYRRKKYKPDKTQFKANERIKAEEVRVIDEKGGMLGIMKTADALAKAKAQGLDLIEVNPKAEPPIVKFQDFGRLQYEREKQKQKAKAKIKKIDTKGVRMSFRISEHDRDVRFKQALKFIDKGHKVKIELTLRGRENAYKMDAIEKVRNFIADVKTTVEEGEAGGEIVVEKQPKKEGGRITAIIAHKK